MGNSPLKVGILGLGNMGKNHLRVLSLLKSVDIRFAYDADPQTLEQLTTQYGVPAADHMPDDFMGVDALFVLTPTSIHKSIVEQALGTIPYIFVEKPLTGSAEDTHDLVEKIRSSRSQVQVGYIERFNPATQVLADMTCGDEGIINIDFTRTSKVSSRITDVGVVTDLMIHDIDLALYLNGPVDSIVAHGKAGNGFVDFASATLVHSSGAMSRILASRITEKKRRLIEMTCMDKFVSCDLLRKEVFINMQTVSSSTPKSYNVTSVEESVMVMPQEALLNEINSFVDACNADDFTHVPTAEDDLVTMDVAEEIQNQIMARQ